MNAPHRSAPVDKASPTYLASLFERRPDEGVYRVNRSVYTDPELYELELTRIFEGSWIFLCHESLLPQPYDYYGTWMGRVPVLVQRSGDGRLNGFVNACSHRGARLCRSERGNRKQHVCTYHGWTYDAEGRALWVQREADGYPAGFERAALGLRRVARLESYRGFVYASLNPDVPTLREHLGGGASFIDMLADQCPDGFTVLPGASTCVYHGNWKLMLENGGGDGLHPDYTHKSLLGVAKRKDQRAAEVRTLQIDKMHEKRGGQWTFGHGHTSIWFNFPNPEARPIYQQRARLETQFGTARAQWMTSIFRNLSVYPNLHLLDQMATLIRTFRPVAVDRTEITFYCLAPVTESARERSHRLRQFEEFFMASGMGTPDDNEEFEQCHQGALGAEAGDSYLSFGLHDRAPGEDAVARELGIPLESSGIIGYEGCTMSQYDEWLRLMTRTGA